MTATGPSDKFNEISENRANFDKLGLGLNDLRVLLSPASYGESYGSAGAVKKLEIGKLGEEGYAQVTIGYNHLDDSLRLGIQTQHNGAFSSLDGTVKDGKIHFDKGSAYESERLAKFTEVLNRRLGAAGPQ
jgi:hypothetical protein